MSHYVSVVDTFMSSDCLRKTWVGDLRSETENKQHVGYNTYPTQNHERSYIYTTLSEISTHRLLIRHTIVILRAVIPV